MAAFAFALATSALRVASLDLCADEYLLAIARDGEIAAVSRLSQDPAENAAWQRARRFPAYRGRVETLQPAKPTLLLAVGSPGGRSTAPIAAKLGMRLLSLPYPASPADVLANLDRVAAALGAPRRARPFHDRFRAITFAPRQALDAVFLGGGGLSVDAGGLSAQWMRLAGYRQRPLPGGRATLERLALDPPSVFLKSDYRAGQSSLGQRWLEHPLARRARARQIRTDGRAWTCGGPPMFDEIERLRRLR